MCGIFGAVRFGGLFLTEEFGRFVSLTDKVSYRGPDDSGYIGINSTTASTFEAGEELRPFDVFLGHRRLSIIDLSSAGRQPMADGRGRWIIFNGEVFNFVELREELERFGYEFRTDTDTEVILHLYDRFGASGFEKMNGMWALAIADLQSRLIVLSRDRFSIKPLYLLSRADRLWFASEIKQLLPLQERKEPNVEVLSTFLVQGILDHSVETCFRGITRVPPKTTLVIRLTNGSVEAKQYWDYGRREFTNSLAAQEEFRELLIDSTRIRLRSDVKVGLLLSGGLDSSALAVAIRESGAEQLETYSVVSDEKRFNEEPFIDEVNRTLGLKAVKFRFQLSHIEATLLQVLNHSDEPFTGLSVLAQYGIFQTIKANTGATVLLSGQGGDEVLLGYLKFFFFYVRDLLRAGKYGAALHRILSSAIRGTMVHQFRLSEAKRYMPSLRLVDYGLLRGKYVPVRAWGQNGMQSRQIADFDTYSIPALTHYEDRNSMAHSLEVRHPFLDHRLVDLALSVPADWQFEGGWSKSLLRRSFPELPSAVRWRRDKQGFTTPEELWLKRDLATLIEQSFQHSVLDEFGILDSGAFLKQYDSFRNANPVISFKDISRSLIAELWARQQWKGSSIHQFQN